MTQPAKTTSTEKYSPEQTAQLLSMWQSFCEACPNWATLDREKADAKIEELATQFQKKTRSIIAKLVRHSVYIAKTPNKSGNSDSKNKLEIAEAIGHALQLSQPEVESLSVAGKQALIKIMHALAGSVPVEVLTPEQASDKAVYIDNIVDHLAISGDTIRDLNALKLASVEDLQAALNDKEFTNNPD